MKIHPVDFGTPEYDELISLRYRVLKEPLGLEFSEESLSNEFEDTHLALYDDAYQLMACLVLSPESGGPVRMRQVAVVPEKQNSGLGRTLVGYSEDWSRRAGFTEMVLHAREQAVSFYEKLGYKKVGKKFEEVGLPHWQMKKKL